MYSVLFSDGMATSFTCATHLQSRKSGYPIQCSFLKADGHLFDSSQGVAIPNSYSFCRIGGHFLYVLYYNVLYCIIPYYQAFTRYHTILNYSVVYYHIS